MVYLPPSYDENPYKAFPSTDTLLMHDGQNLFNASTATYGVAWMCQDTLNPLIIDGQMREVRMGAIPYQTESEGETQSEKESCP